jgi:carbamate kinase
VLLVIALGGNALLERGEPPLSEIQEKHVLAAVDALVPLARDHDLVITHGNGPQVGLLALESSTDPSLPHPYPFDVLDAQTQGMIGYFLLQAFENALPGQEVVSLICQTLVDPADPAFDCPTKFVGSTYTKDEANRLAGLHGWKVRRDGDAWRRVVPSPEPISMVELSTIRMVLANGALVICAGGGGIPVTRTAEGLLRGVEAVVDKDLTAALLARALQADALLLLTDVSCVETGFGTPSAAPLRSADPAMARSLGLPDGSMGPKVEAACRFVEATGGRAYIGRLEDAVELLAGSRGTVIELANRSSSPDLPGVSPIVSHSSTIASAGTQRRAK